MSLPGVVPPGRLFGRGRERDPPAASRAGPGTLLGLEHEYRVFDAEGAAVDFRALLRTLAVPGRRIDPGDLNAYRLPSGLALTADGAEAEIATPPLSVAAGFTGQVLAWAAHGRATLEGLLPACHTLEGYSTHLSVSLDGQEDEVAELYAHTFATAFALVAQQPESLGLYVRPRPGRLELCSDFADGPVLEAAACFAAGSVRACAAAVAGGSALATPRLALELRPSGERAGIRVHRSAPGFDLYAAGRRGVLSREAGGAIVAAELLRTAWREAESALGRDASRADLAAARAMVRGGLPLGVEGTGRRQPGVASPPPLGSPFGHALGRLRSPEFEASAIAGTWSWTVFRVAGPAFSPVHVTVPGRGLGSFLERLEGGALDGELRAALSDPGLPAVPDLALFEAQVTSGPPPPGLLHAEERPAPGPAGKAPRRAGKAAPRLGKAVPWPLRQTPLSPPQPLAPAPRPGRGRPWLAVAVAGAIAGLGGLVAAVALMDGGDSDAPQPTATPTSPAPTETSAPALTETPATPSPSPSPEPTELPSPTGTAPPEPTPTPDGGPQETAAPTSTAVPTATATLSPTPDGGPTATPPPTATSIPRPIPPAE